VKASHTVLNEGGWRKRAFKAPRPVPTQPGRARVTDTRHPAHRPVCRPARPARAARGPARGRDSGAADALAWSALAPDAVYRQGDAAARAQRAQPHPRSVDAQAGRDLAASALVVVWK
jgi:hypothetical protein